MITLEPLLTLCESSVFLDSRASGGNRLDIFGLSKSVPSPIQCGFFFACNRFSPHHGRRARSWRNSTPSWPKWSALGRWIRKIRPNTLTKFRYKIHQPLKSITHYNTRRRLVPKVINFGLSHSLCDRPKCDNKTMQHPLGIQYFFSSFSYSQTSSCCRRITWRCRTTPRWQRSKGSTWSCCTDTSSTNTRKITIHILPRDWWFHRWPEKQRKFGAIDFRFETSYDESNIRSGEKILTVMFVAKFSHTYTSD